MCRDFLTNYRCGHRFTASRKPCLYETQRQESQPRCRFTTVCYSRWDEDGETHCRDCRQEIAKAREGRILTAKREQLEAYELGIAEYTQNIDEHEEEFNRLEAEDDISLVESSSGLGDKRSSSGKATPLTGLTSPDELLSLKADILSYSPTEDETFETELSSFEMALLKHRETKVWAKQVEDSLGKEENEVGGISAKVKPVPEVDKLDGPSTERLGRRVLEMRRISDARDDAERKSSKEKVAELKSMFAKARAQAYDVERAQMLTRLQSLFAEARMQAALLEEK